MRTAALSPLLLVLLLAWAASASLRHRGGRGQRHLGFNWAPHRSPGPPHEEPAAAGQHRRAREAGGPQFANRSRPLLDLRPKTYSAFGELGAKTSSEWWTLLAQSDSPQAAAAVAAVEGGAAAWPLRRVAEVAGDVVVGGLHMIHERNARLTCGPIMPQGGVQVWNTYGNDSTR